MAIEKIKILGAVLALPAKQHCQSSPFGHFCGNWAGLAMLFSWKLKKGPQDFDFFNCNEWWLFIWCEKHWDLGARIYQHNNSSVSSHHEPIPKLQILIFTNFLTDYSKLFIQNFRNNDFLQSEFENPFWLVQEFINLWNSEFHHIFEKNIWLFGVVAKANLVTLSPSKYVLLPKNTSEIKANINKCWGHRLNAYNVTHVLSEEFSLNEWITWVLDFQKRMNLCSICAKVVIKGWWHQNW